MFKRLIKFLKKIFGIKSPSACFDEETRRAIEEAFRKLAEGKEGDVFTCAACGGRVLLSVTGGDKDYFRFICCQCGQKTPLCEDITEAANVWRAQNEKPAEDAYKWQEAQE